MINDKLKDLLQSKSTLLDEIGGALREQEVLLKNGQLRELSDKCDEITSIMKRLEQVNNRLVNIQSSAASGRSTDSDEGLRHLFIKITRQAEANRQLMDSIVVRAINSRDDIKSRLNGTMVATRISGYRPFSGKQPFYLDKRN